MVPQFGYCLQNGSIFLELWALNVSIFNDVRNNSCMRGNTFSHSPLAWLESEKMKQLLKREERVRGAWWRREWSIVASHKRRLDNAHAYGWERLGRSIGAGESSGLDYLRPCIRIFTTHWPIICRQGSVRQTIDSHTQHIAWLPKTRLGGSPEETTTPKSLKAQRITLSSIIHASLIEQRQPLCTSLRITETLEPTRNPSCIPNLSIRGRCLV